MSETVALALPVFGTRREEKKPLQGVRLASLVQCGGAGLLEPDCAQNGSVSASGEVGRRGPAFAAGFRIRLVLLLHTR